MYYVPCTSYIVHCTMYTYMYKVQVVALLVHIVLCTCTMYKVRCTCTMYIVPRTSTYVHSTSYIVANGVHFFAVSSQKSANCTPGSKFLELSTYPRYLHVLREVCGRRENAVSSQLFANRFARSSLATTIWDTRRTLGGHNIYI